MQEKLAAIREAKNKNSFASSDLKTGAGNIKATKTSNRGGGAAGVRKVGSGD